jgi:hypothetical protein
MPRFVETEDGWVNLAHIQTIKPAYSKQQDVYRYVLAGARGGAGSVHSVRSPVPIDWTLEAAEIIPAAPGLKATVLRLLVLEDEDRPEEDDIDVYEQPIIGWRIIGSEDNPQPILPDAAVGRNTVLVNLPDGGLFDSLGRIWNNLDEGKRFVLKCGQGEWDKLQKVKKTAFSIVGRDPASST